VNSGTQDIASSADGSRLVYAIKTSSGQTLYAIYTSTDSGATWVSNTVSKAKWTSVASSADGSKLVAAASGDSAGRIYTWEAAAVLDLAAAGTNLVLSWPALSATTGFGLQQNSDLTTTDWTDVTNTPTVTNGQNQVVLSPPASPLFYRLVSK
jgi:hypothetical protein